MKRVRIEAPAGGELRYLGMDTVHDAAIAMLTAAGLAASGLIGPNAAKWGAGAVFSRKVQPGRDEKFARAVVVSTTDQVVAEALGRIDPASMRSRRSGSGESIDLSGWTVKADDAPADNALGQIAVLCATPVAITRKGDRAGGRWLFDVREGDIEAAVNTRLSAQHGRDVRLSMTPDEGYVNSRRSHATFCKVKADKGMGHVVGLTLPLLLRGSKDDLDLAWYAGLGEKTRMGFGIVDKA